jgi:long-chain acyl-CoA synthetase
MACVTLPAIRSGAALWGATAVAGRAAAWACALADELGRGSEPVGLVLPNRPEAVAAFLALSTLDRALILLPPDPRGWRSVPAIPAGTPLVVPPGCGELGRAGEALGLWPLHLQEPPAAGDPGVLQSRLLRLPGFVVFTSGSTGAPKPVYVSTEAMLRQARATRDAYRLPDGARVAVSLPLSSHYGLGHGLILPLVLGGEMALLERFDPRSLLELFGSMACDYWAGIPVMADLLGRVALPGPVPAAPPICHISAGPLSATTFHTFHARFGVPLRPSYGRSETGFITAECGPAEEIRAETVGRPAPGVRLVIGDDPAVPAPPGQAGRVWLSTPWYMEGYGFPPAHRSGEGRDGLWATEDVGVLDGDERLVLLGRIDDCFKTAAGYLVAPAEIVRALTGVPGARDAVIVPLGGAGGTAIGAVVETAAGTGADDVLAGAVSTLPPWLRPKRLIVTAELPRLPGGKVDRLRCIAMLGEGSP